MARAPDQHATVEALVALAARDGLGERVEWADVEVAIDDLAEDALGPRSLRTIAARLNDPEVARTLEEWFLRAGQAREGDARAADRADDKIVAPLQRVSLAVLAGAGLAFATGTLAGLPALFIGAGAGAVAGTATWARWRLSTRADGARTRAEAIRHLSASLRQTS